MTPTLLEIAVATILASQKRSKKPLAVVLAGHNGSGKSTLWYERLADLFKIPLVNADRMMMSILPETISGEGKRLPLPDWASAIRDADSNWMRVAQKGVEAFVDLAVEHKVPFAMETVFSHFKDLGGGKFESKVDRIQELQKKGYYVLLLFVGLANSDLSILRVSTRVAKGGHAVDRDKLVKRFPRTQRAIGLAMRVADAAILTDNSLTPKEAFSVCRIQLQDEDIFDCRNQKRAVPPAILEWLGAVCPQSV